MTHNAPQCPWGCGPLNTVGACDWCYYPEPAPTPPCPCGNTAAHTREACAMDEHERQRVRRYRARRR